MWLRLLVVLPPCLGFHLTTVLRQRGSIVRSYHRVQKCSPSELKSAQKSAHRANRAYYGNSGESSRLWSSNSPQEEEEFDLMSRFVPIFFGVWALGYSGISIIDVGGGGLGDSGGYVGAGFAVILLLALVAAAAFEVFRDFD